jgi:hypothetical protein
VATSVLCNNGYKSQSMSNGGHNLTQLAVRDHLTTITTGRIGSTHEQGVRWNPVMQS